MSLTGLPFWAVAGLIALSAGVLGLLHLLRVRPRPMRVVTLLFWQHAVERTQARSLLHRFRHPLTYALLLAILSLIALALGKPELTGRGTRPVKHVYVLSAGMGMQAKGPGEDQRRFDTARRALLRDLRGIGSREPVAVVAVDPWPRVLHPFDDPRPVLADRVGGIEPADLPAADDKALAIASHLVRGEAEAEVVLITDRGVAPPASEEDAPSVRVITVGGPVANAAVVSALYEPDTDNPLVGRFSVRVVHHAAAAGEVVVRIERAGGGALLEESRTLGAADDSVFEVNGLRADGDVLRVEVTAKDALKADNTVAYRLPLRRPIRVAVADDAPMALRAVLGSLPYVVDAADEVDVRVVTNTDAAGPTGPAVVLASGTQPVASGARILPADGSGLTRDLHLEGAVIGGGDALSDLPRGAEPLLLAGPAVVAAYVPEDTAPRVVMARALLAEGATLERRPAFAVLLVRSLHRLAGWQGDAMTIPPERSVSEPLLAQRMEADGRVQVMPGSRSSADLMVDSPSEAASERPTRWYRPELFEVLLWLAVALACLEAALHARGRIP